MVKDAGLNFIRGSHCPKAPAFADACDELGLLFWSENCFWGGFGGAAKIPSVHGRWLRVCRIPLAEPQDRHVQFRFRVG
jgi:beta-galactosidase/beta-glucuronidase